MKKKSIGKISENDKALFRESVGIITPVDSSQNAQLNIQKIEPFAAQRAADEEAVLKETILLPPDTEILMESGEEIYFRRNGVSQQTIRKLRRGYWKVEGSLDLHGYTRIEAKEILVNFLSTSIRNRHRCVRIVHGKGLGSKNREPVLKKKIVGWLRYIDSVMGFCQAPPINGGSGATVVLLRSNKKNNR